MDGLAEDDGGPGVVEELVLAEGLAGAEGRVAEAEALGHGGAGGGGGGVAAGAPAARGCPQGGGERQGLSVAPRVQAPKGSGAGAEPAAGGFARVTLTCSAAAKCGAKPLCTRAPRQDQAELNTTSSSAIKPATAQPRAPRFSQHAGRVVAA